MSYVIRAFYRGIENYGAEETNKYHKDQFRYRFQIDEKEELFFLKNGAENKNGVYDYSLQNTLKEGYSYKIVVEDGIITDAHEIPEGNPVFYVPPIYGTPGKHTLGNFIATALQPVGTTLYIYGGGWDWQDEGAANQARTIGLSPDWIRFFKNQDENFTYKSKDGDESRKNPSNSYYPYGGYNQYYFAGLDCSGFVGWTLYNTFYDTNGQGGFVVPSTRLAKMLAEQGYGEWTQKDVVPDGRMESRMKPGDIMSINGHVWISLGTCEDQSVVIVHSTPSNSRTGQPGGGVQIGSIGTSRNCEAYQLADYYMSKYYPEWYRRYPVSLHNPNTYFAVKGNQVGKFSWDTSGGEKKLTDPGGYQGQSANTVLKALFGE